MTKQNTIANEIINICMYKSKYFWKKDQENRVSGWRNKKVLNSMITINHLQIYKDVDNDSNNKNKLIINNWKMSSVLLLLIHVTPRNIESSN